LADDRELCERICRGDVQAFEALYRMHGPKLEVFLRRALGNRQAAEDVMQETFTRIWQHPNGFEPERGTLRAYLFGVGRKLPPSGGASKKRERRQFRVNLLNVRRKRPRY
jgi:RNA polymerase sigma-70 factor (ECF subfamily)